jgi:hypothetical protein
MNLNPQPLFNKTVIEKLLSKIELTDLQKQSALDWIKMIENNQLDKEQENQNEFEDYILHNILGYEIRECKREKLDIDYTIDIPGFTKSLCIEVKGTKTKDLFKDQKRKDDSKFNPVIQLYTYMGHGYDYGVVTNYNDFILLTQNTQLVKAHKFNFLSIKRTEDRIDENKLKEFILLFSKKEVFVNNSIEELSNQTVLSEKEFTDEFYKLFHETRLMLITEFEESSDIPHDVAIHYSQIFLNRLIFIYFAEDHNFIPSSLFEKRILGILQSPSIDESTHLIYDDILGLFKIMNTGSKVQGVNGFNGGLFGDDVIPSNITFSDLRNANFFSQCYQNSTLEIKTTSVDIAVSGIYAEKLSPLIKNLLIMASHDFTSDLNVNILGHIFEQSISDIESLDKNEISKRKKDGVFYTPDHVTDYICRNTIIPYLSKTEKTSIIELVDEYSENLEDLELKLKNLKILDPACGSGAFLVKAVDILLEIDNEIQFRKPVKSSPQTGMDEYTKIKDINLIIENNIYGVDLNPASVDITKLSLFLKLAGPESKLGYLSNNIKHANSLIEDKIIASNAFSWENEFPEILNSIIEEKGFDIILGNPPYVRQEKFKEIKNYLQQNYDIFTSTADLYTYFYELGLNKLSKNGVLGYISSNKFMRSKYGLHLRNLLKNKTTLIKIIDFEDVHMFDATTNTAIVIAKNHYQKNNIFSVSKNIDSKQHKLIHQDDLDDSAWTLEDTKVLHLKKKMEKIGVALKQWNVKINRGLLTGFNEAYVINSRTKINLCNEDPKNEEILKPIIRGRDIGKYFYTLPDLWIINTHNGYSTKAENIPPINTVKDYPSIYKYLKKINEENDGEVEKRCDQGNHWTNLRNCAFLEDFKTNKIIWLELTNENKFAFSTDEEYALAGSFIMTGEPLKYLLGYLNSSICKFYFKLISNSSGMGTIQWKKFALERMPIPKIDGDIQKLFEDKVTEILNLRKKVEEIKTKLKVRIIQNIKLVKFTNKLSNFYELSFKQFIEELKKQKISLTLKQQDEWDKYFNDNKNMALNNLKKITQLESEINTIIYKSFELNDDEIKLLENNL